jgi:hypothetical protein
MDPSPTPIESQEDDSLAGAAVPYSPDSLKDAIVTRVRDDAELLPTDSVASTVSDGSAIRQYPSLYDSTNTTVAAIIMGAMIVGAIQVLVVKMYTSAKSEHVYLTRFVTSLVALIVGCYIADLLIAGPDTSLLTAGEKTLILTFVKDTALMIFSYYFGLKAQAPREDSHE